MNANVLALQFKTSQQFIFLKKHPRAYCLLNSSMVILFKYILKHIVSKCDKNKIHVYTHTLQSMWNWLLTKAHEDRLVNTVPGCGHLNSSHTVFEDHLGTTKRKPSFVQLIFWFRAQSEDWLPYRLTQQMT